MEDKMINNSEPVLTRQSVQEEIRRTRHSMELPLYALSIIAGVIGLIFIIIQFDAETSILKDLWDEISSGATLPGIAIIFETILYLLGIIGGVGALIFFTVVYIVMLYKVYGEQMSYSIRVSEKNYPEIYHKAEEFSRLLGWRKAPEIYVQQMNGEVNAFTSWVPGKVFIQLNAEVVDIAYLEHKDFDTIYFIMAHEFGHAYLHHVQIYYTIWNVLANFIPGIGPYFLMPMLSRAREYSADRVGQALTGGRNELECMMFLAAGRHAYKYVDPIDYMEWIYREHNFLEGLARFVVNMIADHPVMPFRTAAIMDKRKRNGRLL